MPALYLQSGVPLSGPYLINTGEWGSVRMFGNVTFQFVRFAYSPNQCILTSLTLILDLADVSIKAQLNCWAKLTPWSVITTLSSSKSHLLPTRTIGTSSVSCKVNIILTNCCRAHWRKGAPPPRPEHFFALPFRRTPQNLFSSKI